MGSYRLTKKAAADLQAIGDYLSEQNLRAAERLLNDLEDHFTLLAENTKLGRARPEIGRDLRYFPVRNYLIFYRPLASGVEIVRVVYGGRNLQALFEPEEGD